MKSVQFKSVNLCKINSQADGGFKITFDIADIDQDKIQELIPLLKKNVAVVVVEEEMP